MIAPYSASEMTQSWLHWWVPDWWVSSSNQKTSSKSKLYHSILLLLNFHLPLNSIQRQASKDLSRKELTKSKWKCTAACKRGHMHAHIHKHRNLKKKKIPEVKRFRLIHFAFKLNSNILRGFIIFSPTIELINIQKHYISRRFPQLQIACPLKNINNDKAICTLATDLKSYYSN